MSETFSMEAFHAEVKKAIEQDPTAQKVGPWVDKVFTRVNEFLQEQSFSAGALPGMESLWRGNVTQLNSDSSRVSGLDKSELINLLTELKVPRDQQINCAMECLRALSNGTTREDILEVVQPGERGRDVTTLFGQRGANTVGHDVKFATEAFGQDANNAAVDNRLSIVLAVLRTNSSVLDKVLPRVAENSNYIVLKTDMGEVMNLTSAYNSDPKVRNSASARRPLVDLFRTPDMVNSAPQAVVPLLANDTDNVKRLVASVETTVTDPNALVVGVTANLWNLVASANTFGFQTSDYTDLLAEGGRIKNVLVKVTSGTGSSATSEIFSVPVQYQPTAKFAQTNNNIDTLEQAVNLKFDYQLRAGRTTIDGVTASKIFTDFKTSVVQLHGTLNVMFNLSSGNIVGNASVETAVAPATGYTSVDATAQTDYGNMSVAIIGYTPDLYFDEENMRKTNITVRVKTKENTFTIPNGRNYVFDLALQQETDQSTLGMISTVSALGNSIRGLNIIESTLSEVADQLEFLQENPELQSLVDPRNMSLASSVVIPSVVRGTLNLNDGNTYVMRESERLTEGHARLRETLLYSLSMVCAKSAYLNQLGTGETPVFKIVTHSLIRSVLFGIKDYHPILNDETTAESGAELSMTLPNGFRIDVASSIFTSLENTLLIFPIRQADPTSVTSAFTTRTRGDYTAQYNPINQQGVSRRVIQNTREIVFPTNPIGGILTIENLDQFLTTLNAQFAPHA